MCYGDLSLWGCAQAGARVSADPAQLLWGGGLGEGFRAALMRMPDVFLSELLPQVRDRALWTANAAAHAGTGARCAAAHAACGDGLRALLQAS